MPKTLWDWLTVATLWLGALLLVLKSADMTLPQGFPTFLASPLWTYAPLLLITAAAVMMLYRTFRPAFVPPAQEAAPAPAQESPDQQPGLWGDISAAEVAGYLETQSRWGVRLAAVPEADRPAMVALQIMDKLAAGALQGWVRPETAKPLALKAPHFWKNCQMTLPAGYVYWSEKYGSGIAFLDLHLNVEEVIDVWPRR